MKIENLNEKMEKFIKENDNLFNIVHAYDYREYPDELMLKQTLQEVKDELFEEIYNSEYADTCNDNYLYYAMEKFLEQEGLKKEIPEYCYSAFELKQHFDCDDIDDLYETFHEHINIDYITDIIENHELRVNLIPLQDENLNQEGGELMPLIGAIQDEDLEEVKEFQKDNPDCIVNKLFESQGYNLMDLFDNQKYENSKFLKSFYNEIYNCYKYDLGFIIMLAKVSLTDFYDIMENERTIELKDPVCGIVNLAQGGGSILGIELEKPFRYKYAKGRFTNCQIEDKLKGSEIGGYGYLVDSIYGLALDAWDCEIKIIKEDDENSQNAIENVDNKENAVV